MYKHLLFFLMLCSGQLQGQTPCLQDYFLHFPGDIEVSQCNGAAPFTEPVIYRKDCELVAISHSDDTLKLVPNACYMIRRTWKVINWQTFNANKPLITVPNPLGLNGDVKVTPYPASTTGITSDSVSTLAATSAGSAAIDYNSFWKADANGYLYTQLVTVQDALAPVITTLQNDTIINDVTDNSPRWYVNPNLNDPVHNQHDLCEGQPNLQISGTDLCTGAGLNVRYLLFLDTDGDGTMETVVNSFSPPKPGFLNIGNAANPNYSGGTEIQIDSRELSMSIGVPLNDNRYKFVTQTTVSGSQITAKVAFNTIANPNTFIPAILPYGKHKIKWLITDNCGNEVTHENFITIRDGKAPTVICAPIVVNMMPTGMIDIWDTELLQYTLDNCTPTAQLETAICRGCTTFPVDNNGLPVKNVRFTCADLGGQLVRIFSRDKSNPRNADYCEITVLLQDNLSNACPTNPPTQPSIGGTIIQRSSTMGGVSNVPVQLTMGGGPAISGLTLNLKTDGAGNYGLLSNIIPIAGTVTIIPSVNTDHQNGVDMLDVLKIQRHILGIEPIISPYAQIAGDVNNSRSITSSDIVEMRKLILGAKTTFSGVNSYRFVLRDFVFPNQNNPFTTVFPEIGTGDGAILPIRRDFIMIKSGDVTGNAVYNPFGAQNDERAQKICHLTIPNSNVQFGEQHTVQFTSNELLDALQLTLQHPGLEILSTTLPEGHFILHDGALTIATDAAVSEFTITFRALQSGNLSEMLEITNSITKSEGFIGEERYEPVLAFSGEEAGYALYPNIPNPFTQATDVRFYLPKAERVTLIVYDVLGRIIHSESRVYESGKQSIRLLKSQLNSPGVLTYTLQTDSWFGSGQMIFHD
jgi:hypothetical protein